MQGVLKPFDRVRQRSVEVVIDIDQVQETVVSDHYWSMLLQAFVQSAEAVPKQGCSFGLSFALDSSPNNASVDLFMPVSASQSVHDEAHAVLLVHGLHEDTLVSLFRLFFCGFIPRLDTDQILQPKGTQVWKVIAYCLMDQSPLEVVERFLIKTLLPQLSIVWCSTEAISLVISL